MAEPKTKKTKASVTAFLNAVEHETRRADAKQVAKMMRAAAGEAPAMWGESIVGFSAYPTASGDWPIIAFSPRKSSLVLYIQPGFTQYAALLARLGKHKTGASCLYVNKLADVDAAVLQELMDQSVVAMKTKYGL
jgi:hypothetical protein